MIITAKRRAANARLGMLRAPATSKVVKPAPPEPVVEPRGVQAARYIKEHSATLAQAAKAFGISTQAVRWGWHRIYPGEGRPTPPPPPVTPIAPEPEARATQAALHAQEHHVTLTKAAQLFGVTREQVVLAWERLGFKPRVQT